MSTVDVDNFRIVTITSPEDATFVHKFINGTVALSFNPNYTAFAIDTKTVFVYENNTSMQYIREILESSNIAKLSSKPLASLKSYFKNINCNNCTNIGSYITQKGDSRDVPEMKLQLIDLDTIELLSDRAAQGALIVMKYKIDTDKKGKPPKKQKVSYFNKKRDCYLLYLTAYNDLLSLYGPMNFMTLVTKVRDYKYLCRTSLHPAAALEGLIKAKALISNPRTTIITIPDQND